MLRKRAHFQLFEENINLYIHLFLKQKIVCNHEIDMCTYMCSLLS